MPKLGLDQTERLNLTLSTAAVAASLLAGSPAFGGSIALGTAIEALNYRALRRATDRFFGGQLGGSRAWTAGFALRFLLLGAAMYLAIRAGVNPIGLVIGLSMVVPAVVIAAWRARPPVGVAALAPPPDDESWDRWNPWLAQERDEFHEGDDA